MVPGYSWRLRQRLANNVVSSCLEQTCSVLVVQLCDKNQGRLRIHLMTIPEDELDINYLCVMLGCSLPNVVLSA